MTGTCSMPDTKTAVPIGRTALLGENPRPAKMSLDTSIGRVSAPATTAFLGRNPRPAKMFLDTSIEQVAGHTSREGHWGWDGACLETVSAIAHDPIGYWGGMNLYAYCGDSPLVYVDPAGLVGKPDCCCCCVEDLSIANIKKLTQLPLYGHSFDAVIKMKYIKDKIHTDCTLKWKEKTNRHYTPGMPDNQWTDMYSLLPNSPTFDPWNNRKPPCPGNLTVTITDTPMANVNLPARQLYFAITVESGKDCPCSTLSITVYATQLLEPNGKGGILKQDFSLGVGGGAL